MRRELQGRWDIVPASTRHSGPKGHKGRKILISMSLSLVLGLVLAASAVASVTFDAETGTGFVGKGDVQLVYGWNNKALQTHAGEVDFRVNSQVVTEVSWICTNSNNENTQERARETTTSVEGVIVTIARERNQITGFNLTGFDGASTQSTETEGPPVDSCPKGPWSLTTPAGDPQVTSQGSGSGLQVSYDGNIWSDVQ